MSRIFLFSFFLSFNTFSQITTVNQDGSGDFITITAAVNASSSGDTIIVNPGTYNETIDYNGKNIVLGSLYLTTKDTSYVTSTIIDGTDKTTQGVRFSNGESSSAKLVGFTITNFKLKDIASDRGGGIRIINSSPTLENLIITNNSAEWGGGIYIENGLISTTNISLKNLKITSNTGDWGGGISAYATTATLENILISKNSGVETGGGILWWGSTSTSDTQTLTNVTITDNTSSTSSSKYYGGGGVHLRHPVNMNIKNSIIWNNTLPQIKMHNDDGYPMTLNVSYSDVQGGLTGVFEDQNINTITWSNNIDSDPKFIDPLKNDFRLKDISLLIGAGTNLGAPTTDILGNVRPNPNGSNSDMGTYENALAVNTPPNVVISLSSNILLEYEGENVTVTATLAHTSSQDARVIISATGTASGDSVDYSLSSDTINIPAGQTTGTITVNVMTDQISDDGETIILDIDSVVNAIEATEQKVTITISEDICADSGGSTLSGVISSDRTFYKSCSPYTVTNNLLIKEGVSLVIEPGVVIEVSPDKYIRVEGNY